jgi:hypothetical protein
LPFVPGAIRLPLGAIPIVLDRALHRGVAAAALAGLAAYIMPPCCSRLVQGSTLPAVARMTVQRTKAPD